MDRQTDRQTDTAHMTINQNTTVVARKTTLTVRYPRYFTDTNVDHGSLSTRSQIIQNRYNHELKLTICAVSFRRPGAGLVIRLGQRQLISSCIQCGLYWRCQPKPSTLTHLWSGTHCQTSSSTVAERPRDALGPSVVSFSSVKPRTQSFIIVTEASDPQRAAISVTIRLADLGSCTDCQQGGLLQLGCRRLSGMHRR